MKVCTDSLLFGAMAPVKMGISVLDIGAGSGLLSLMTAQLGARQITAVEICREAYLEASGNFSNSQWSERLRAVHQDIQSYAFGSEKRFDLIVSNPPFFEQHLKAAGAKRVARHTDSLPFAELTTSAEKLLAPDGVFYVLLPSHAITQFSWLAQAAGLFLTKQVNYRSFADKPAKVSTLIFSRIKADCDTQTMTVYASNGVYTAESTCYLRPFLLRFAG